MHIRWMFRADVFASTCPAITKLQWRLAIMKKLTMALLGMALLPGLTAVLPSRCGTERLNASSQEY